MTKYIEASSIEILNFFIQKMEEEGWHPVGNFILEERDEETEVGGYPFYRKLKSHHKTYYQKMEK